MNEKTLKVEISNEIAGKIYYATLQFPANDLEIEDGLQQARTNRERKAYETLSVYNCQALPELQGKRLDSPTIKELNFLAARLARLNEEELLVLHAVAPRYLKEEDEEQLVSIKDVINLTYGLDKVPLMSAVSNDEELGAFVIENDLHPEIAKLPESSLPLLDKAVVGKWMRENDGGVFIGNKYIVAGEYELPEIYDGITLPEQKQEERYVFRLKVSSSSANVEDKETLSQWISLPMMRIEADRIAKAFGAEKIEDCACTGFESVIPKIEEKDIRDLSGFTALNFIASQYIKMSPEYRMKYKAILCREEGFDLEYATESLRRLDQYELDPKVEYAYDYFREFLCLHLDVNFDTSWLDDVNFVREGQIFKERTGAVMTPYGVVSACGAHLYENISRLEKESISAEKQQAIEIFGMKALFCNTRLARKEIPEGLYRYELREGEHGEFSTIEERVTVNHMGTVLTKEPIDLGKNGYLELDEETSPNFLGYDETIEEFLGEEQTEKQEGGMTQ